MARNLDGGHGCARSVRRNAQVSQRKPGGQLCCDPAWLLSASRPDLLRLVRVRIFRKDRRIGATSPCAVRGRPQTDQATLKLFFISGKPRGEGGRDLLVQVPQLVNRHRRQSSPLPHDIAPARVPLQGTVDAAESPETRPEFGKSPEIDVAGPQLKRGQRQGQTRERLSQSATQPSRV